MSECPAPPLWGPYIGYPPREVSRQANRAIEMAYRDDPQKQGHGVLFGSQFEEGFAGQGILREIRLPDKAPNKEFGNLLLNELRGPRGGPRKPDIVDFTDRVFYEIKTIFAFTEYRQSVIEQHLSLYRLAEQIVNDFNQAKRNTTAPGGRLAIQDPWSVNRADWTPPQCLDVPGFINKFKITVFRGDLLGDGSCRGILVYTLWQRNQRKEEEVQTPVQVVVEDKDHQYDKLLPSADGLREAVGNYNINQPRHLVIVPKYFHDALRAKKFIEIKPPKAAAPAPVQPAQPSIFSRVKTFATEHPYLTAGTIVAVLVVGGAVAFVAISASAATVTAATAATAAAEEGGAVVISLAARRLATQAAAEAVQKAAAAIFVVGTVENVQNNTVSFSKIGYGRVIAEGSVSPYRGTNSALSSGLYISDSADQLVCSPDSIEVGDIVMFDSEMHSVAATLTAYPNNLSSHE
jgi:hypothetical protein